MYPIELTFLIFPALCLFLAMIKAKKNRATFAFVFIAFFFLYILSLNGADIIGYRDIYRLIASPSTFNEAHGEIGFKLLMWVCTKLKISYLAFRIILLTVTNFVLFYTLYKISPNYTLSLFFLTTMFVIYTISTYRQFMVMSFAFRILYKHSQKSIPMAFIALALLSFIHISALALLAALIVYSLRRGVAYKALKLSKCVIIWILVALFLRYMLIFVMRIDPIKAILSTLTRGYTDESIALFPIGLLSRVVFLLGISIIYRFRKPKDKLTVMLFYLYFLGMLLYTAVPFEGLMGRLMNNFNILGIALVPMLYRYERVVEPASARLLSAREKTCSNIIVIVLVFVAIAVLINQLLNQSGYWPYLNILFGDKLS